MAAANAVREFVCYANVVKLRGWLVVPGTPSVSTVHGDDCALIADQQNRFRVVGINPEVLVIIAAGGAAKTDPCFSAVGRAHSDDAGAVNHVRIFRVHFGDRQVAAPDAVGWAAVGGSAMPGFTSIVRTVEAQTRAGRIISRFCRAHGRVQTARLAWGDGGGVLG